MDNIAPKFSDFFHLMPVRIQEILLVSSKYDAFILQEDGQLTEQLFHTFLNLNLRYAPRITRVSGGEAALEVLSSKRVDLVIIMPQLGDVDPMILGEQIKATYETMPVVLLSYNSRDMLAQQRRAAAAGFDKMFVWTGNSRIFLSIIKYVEDKLNVRHDIARAGVRVVIVVEDSPYYYSTFLPILYTIIMTQTQRLMSQGLNDMHRLLRMRARPKILLASTYDEAMEMYSEFRGNVLGVLSDVRYPVGGVIDPRAGFKLIETIRHESHNLPIVLMSKEPQNREKAYAAGAQFIDKNSSTLIQDMKQFVQTQFGFGDFVFRLPTGQEVARAKDLKSFLRELKRVPRESLLFHATFDHFSTWLLARSEFVLASKFLEEKVSSFESVEQMRTFMVETITKFRELTQKGIITQFSLEDFDFERDFTKISSGSIGGKARGITFISNLLSTSDINEKYEDVCIGIPKTLLIGTDAFDQFMELNDLEEWALRIDDDAELRRIFSKGSFSPEFVQTITTVLEDVTEPLAVRSSSLLEDSHYQPFAGIYATYMVSNRGSIEERVENLLSTVKLVYSSVFTKKAKAYLKSTGHLVDDEKMGVIIQQIVGRSHDNLFYPDVSGVAQSYNFFPISHMQPEDGVAHVALGLGRMIVDDGKGLMFSPVHPEILPQQPTIGDALKNSQTTFYALDLDHITGAKGEEDESASLRTLELHQASLSTLEYMASTYVAQDRVIRDSIYYDGPRILTFAPVLKYGRFPLPELIQDILEIGTDGMGTAVEIEFAIEFSTEKDKPHRFYFLQIRPMVAGEEFLDVKVESADQEKHLCFSTKALGNGRTTNIHDVVFVDPELFHASKTQQIAAEIGRLNASLEGRPYLLIGLGRWGSSDPWLGIPVSWDEISNVAAVVEAGIQGFNIDLSMGTHFFHNMTSLRIAYLTAPYSCRDGCFVDWDWLKAQPAETMTEHLRHLRFERPLEVRIDGRKGNGVILKPH